MRKAWLPVLLVALAGCHRPSPQDTFRLGFFPNLTHAQALVGDRDGDFARALAPARLELSKFNAGPPAIEALISGSVDATYVGTGPAITAWARAPGALHVISGAAANGAVLVARTAHAARELEGKRVGSPQLGNTQDVALRTWLTGQHLRVAAPGTRAKAGEVEVVNLPNSDLLALMKRGELEAAWVPEPWGTRMIREAGAHLLLDEAALWPGRLFPTTVLVASTRAIRTKRAQLEKLVEVNQALTRRAQKDPEAFARKANEAFGKLTGHPLPPQELHSALARLKFTTDPLPAQLGLAAAHARALGFIPSADVAGLVDWSFVGRAVGGSPPGR